LLHPSLFFKHFVTSFFENIFVIYFF
jgi:hypothetical protein